MQIPGVQSSAQIDVIDRHVGNSMYGICSPSPPKKVFFMVDSHKVMFFPLFRIRSSLALFHRYRLQATGACS